MVKPRTDLRAVLGGVRGALRCCVRGARRGAARGARRGGYWRLVLLYWGSRGRLGGRPSAKAGGGLAEEHRRSHHLDAPHQNQCTVKSLTHNES